MCNFGAQETPSQHQATVLLSQAFRFWLLGLRSHPGVHFSGGKMKQVCPRLMNPHPIIPQNRVVRSVVWLPQIMSSPQKCFRKTSDVTQVQPSSFRKFPVLDNGMGLRLDQTYRYPVGALCTFFVMTLWLDWIWVPKLIASFNPFSVGCMFKVCVRKCVNALGTEQLQWSPLVKAQRSALRWFSVHLDSKFLIIHTTEGVLSLKPS